MTNHAQGDVEASTGEMKALLQKMNGLRPTDETRGRQALSATSNRIPKDTTTTLPTQATQGAARTAQHQNMPKQAANWHEKKERDKRRQKRSTRRYNLRNPQMIKTKTKSKSTKTISHPGVILYYMAFYLFTATL